MTDTTQQTRIPYKAFIAACARSFYIDVARVTSNRRDRKTCQARFACATLIKIHRGASMPEIGRRLGGRDHTTILHGLRKAKVLMVSDPVFRSQYLAAEQDALSWSSREGLAGFCGPSAPPPLEIDESQPVAAPEPAKRAVRLAVANHDEHDPIEVRLMRIQGQLGTDRFAAALMSGAR